MTIPKNIIEKAIEGGWLDSSNLPGIYKKLVENTPELGTWTDWFYKDYLQDGQGPKVAFFCVCSPSFWESLVGESSLVVGESATFNGTERTDKPLWLETAHRFFDLILTEQPHDQFWIDLLAKET